MWARAASDFPERINTMGFMHLYKKSIGSAKYFAKNRKKIHMRYLSKYLHAILLALSMSATAHAQEVIDVSKPVTNPRLTAAMDRLEVEKSNSAQDVLFSELNKANYIALAMNFPTSDPLANSKNQIILPAGVKFDLLLTGKGGKKYLLLFTDWSAANKYLERDHPNEKFKGIILPSKDAWDFFNGTLSSICDGIVINPAHNALVLNKGLVNSLLKTSKTNKK